MGDAGLSAPRGAGKHSPWDRGAPPARGRRTMRSRFFAVVSMMVVVAGAVCLNLRPVHAGEQPSASGYKVQEPIRHGSLTVFPIVAPKSFGTGEFINVAEAM